MVEGNSVDGHEVTEMVLVRDVVAVPSDHIKRRVILHRTHEAFRPTMLSVNGQFTTKCKGDGVTALKWQISRTYRRDHVANWLMCESKRFTAALVLSYDFRRDFTGNSELIFS